MNRQHEYITHLHFNLPFTHIHCKTFTHICQQTFPQLYIKSIYLPLFSILFLTIPISFFHLSLTLISLTYFIHWWQIPKRYLINPFACFMECIQVSICSVPITHSEPLLTQSTAVWILRRLIIDCSISNVYPVENRKFWVIFPSNSMLSIRFITRKLSWKLSKPETAGVEKRE